VHAADRANYQPDPAPTDPRPEPERRDRQVRPTVPRPVDSGEDGTALRARQPAEHSEEATAHRLANSAIAALAVWEEAAVFAEAEAAVAVAEVAAVDAGAN